MKKFLALALFATLVALPSMAETATVGTGTNFHVFGGYQFFRDGFSGGENLNGIEGAFAVNVVKHLNITADIGTASKKVTSGGASATDRITTYTFGPSFFVNSHAKVNPFAHVLVGGATLSASASAQGFSASVSQNALAIKMGGGVDARINRRIGIRILQMDWNIFHANNATAKDEVSLATGVVVNF